jgi:hypothetical protein
MAPGAVASFHDLWADPREQRDLLESEPPEALASMQEDLLAFVDAQVLATRGAQAEPVNEAFLQALKEGGYWEQVQGGHGDKPGDALPRKGERPR